MRLKGCFQDPAVFGSRILGEGRLIAVILAQSQDVSSRLKRVLRQEQGSTIHTRIR